MAGIAELMREIHRLRKYARDLQEQLDRLPRQLKARQTGVTQAEANLHEALETIKKLKVAAHEHEVSLRATHTKIKKHEKQLDEAGGKKEYDALQHEIAAEKAEAGQIEEKILAAISESEERSGGLGALEAALQKARDEYATFEKTIGERRDGLMVQLTETLAKLESIEVGVPDTVRTQYNRIVTAMGPDGLAPVHGRTCTNCYTEITAQNYRDLQMGAYFLCKSCGRILYLPE